MNDGYVTAARFGDEYILNGDLQVMWEKRIEGPGYKFDYSGHAATLERFNSTGTIDKDLVIEVMILAFVTIEFFYRLW